MSPCSMVGMYLSYKCRSEPQMQVLVMRTIASRGLRIFGSGTSCTCIFSLPIQQTAFIFNLLLLSHQESTGLGSFAYRGLLRTRHILPLAEKDLLNATMNT